MTSSRATLLFLLSALVLAPALADVSRGAQAEAEAEEEVRGGVEAFAKLHSLHSSFHHGRSLETLNATNQTACGSMCDVFETYRSYRNLFLGYLAGPDNCTDKCKDCITYNDTVFTIYLGNLTGGISPETVQYYNCTSTTSNGAHPTLLLLPALVTAVLAVATTVLLGL